MFLHLVQYMFEDNKLMINERNNSWETGALDHPLGRGVNFQIKVSDVESLITSLQENNYQLYEELQENWYRKNDKEVGNKEFLVQDPDGYLLRFAQDLGERNVV